MNSTRQRRCLILFVFQQLILSVFGYCHPPDFITEEGPKRLTLRQTLRVPVGLRDSVSNSLLISRHETPCVAIAEGTPLQEIPAKITKRREELGLPSQIPLDQQNEFFQNLTWSRLLSSGTFPIKAPMPGQLRRLLVQQSQRVAKGDPLCVIEIMKMQTVLRAFYPGVINQIVIQENGLINTNDALIVLEPSVPFWEALEPSLVTQHRDFLLSFFPWERTLLEENQQAVPRPPAPERTGKNTSVPEQREDIEPQDLAGTNASPSRTQPIEVIPSLPGVPNESPEISGEPIPGPLAPVPEEPTQPSPTAERVDEFQQPEQVVLISPVTVPEETKLMETEKTQQVTEQATMTVPEETQSLNPVQAPLPLVYSYTSEKLSEPQLSFPSTHYEELKLNMVNMTPDHKPLVEQDEVILSETTLMQNIDTSFEREYLQEGRKTQTLFQESCGIVSRRVERFVLPTRPFVILGQGKLCFSLKNISLPWSDDLNFKGDFRAKKSLNLLCKLSSSNPKMTNGVKATIKGNNPSLKAPQFLDNKDALNLTLSPYAKWLGGLLVLGNLLLSIKTFGFPSLLSPILSLGFCSFSPLSSIKLLKACHFNRQELLKEIKVCNQNSKPVGQKKNRIKRYASIGLHGRAGGYCVA
jgi:biotin carboxyl carrier protein